MGDEGGEEKHRTTALNSLNPLGLLDKNSICIKAHRTKLLVLSLAEYWRSVIFIVFLTKPNSFGEIASLTLTVHQRHLHIWYMNTSDASHDSRCNN